MPPVTIEDLTPVVDEPIIEVDKEETHQAEEVEEEAKDDEGEVIVSIGDEPPPEDEEKAAPEWVRELRKSHREQQKRIRELEAAQSAAPSMETAPKLGKKPTLEDHDYDADAFEVALTNWHDQKRKVEESKAKAEEEEKAQAKAWQDKLDAYAKSKKELKVGGYDDAEAAVQEALNVTQQGIIIQGSENPALLIYALGKNPPKAKELAAIKDPVKFTFAIAKLETQLKVTSKKAPPPPEKVVTGTGRVSGSSDATLERLRAEAERTGDMSKVVAYKRSKRAA